MVDVDFFSCSVVAQILFKKHDHNISVLSILKQYCYNTKCRGFTLLTEMYWYKYHLMLSSWQRGKIQIGISKQNFNIDFGIKLEKISCHLYKTIVLLTFILSVEWQNKSDHTKDAINFSWKLEERFKFIFEIIFWETWSLFRQFFCIYIYLYIGNFTDFHSWGFKNKNTDRSLNSQHNVLATML